MINELAMRLAMAGFPGFEQAVRTSDPSQVEEYLKWFSKLVASTASSVCSALPQATEADLMRAINPFGDKRFTFAEAQKACADLRIGGFTDWRAPTLKELFAMTDHTRFKPAVNPDEYPDIASDWYWSSDVDPESPSAFAFGVYFYDGTAGFGYQYGRGRVLAVRSCAAATGGTPT